MKLFYYSISLLLFIGFSGCTGNNVTIDDSFKKYFDDNQVTGTFGIYDNAHNQFIIYNLGRFKDSAYLPASTFKIVNSLIGLETGRIRDEKMVIKWDGVTRLYPNGDTAKDWNKDLTMAEAFKASAVPYYQEVARRIGKDTMQHWLDTLGYASRYGKPKITGSIDSFWLDNSVKITADEQVGLVKALYFGQLPFQKRTQDIVRNVMAQDTASGKYKLYYKTGWGFKEDAKALGWVTGWIEENKHVYFFALNAEGPHNTDMKAVRLNILKGILNQQGFFQGKK